MEPEQQQDREEPQAPQEDLRGPPEPKKLVVDLDDDDGPEDKASVSEPDKKTRRQQARDYRRQIAERDREMQEMRSQLAELRGRVAAPPAPPVRESRVPDDPIDGEIGKIESRQKALTAAIQAPGQTQEQVDTWVNMWRDLETDRRRLEFRKFSQSERGGQDDDKQEDRYINTALMAEFPQIFQDEALQYQAKAEMTRLLRLGKPRGLATAREAATRALAAAGIGRKPPAPSDLERTRLAGIPARAGVAGNGSGNQYTPSKFEINLARGFTKHLTGLDDEERVRVWLKATGGARRTG